MTPAAFQSNPSGHAVLASHSAPFSSVRWRIAPCRALLRVVGARHADAPPSATVSSPRPARRTPPPTAGAAVGSPFGACAGDRRGRKMVGDGVRPAIAGSKEPLGERLGDGNRAGQLDG